MVKIEWRGLTASIEDGCWTGDQPLLAMCEAFARWDNIPKSYVPDEDVAAALIMVERYGATITYDDIEPVPFEPDVIY